MALKNTVLLLTAALGALAGPVTRRPAELPVAVIEGASKDLNSLELPQANQAILLFRSRLGENGTNALIAPDVAAADTFWHKTLSNSTTGKFVGGTMRAQGYAPRSFFNSTTVALWFYFGGTGWPNDFLQSSPEHYLSLSGPGVRDPKAALESIENWGPGPITYFKGFPETKPDFIPTLTEFPADYQRPLALQLADGTVFAHSLTAFRDLPGGIGVEIYQGIWIPDSAPAEVLQGLRAHITVEFSNWLKLAYKKALKAA
ncbi:hypothetical protein EV127DRAFT_221747 [Xylaria flabelliformis]|nr:hypothetical protein EV127DRAFT_221747 [Xylaria flabelliformis]KAI0855680.1 hypothetical protein F4860DRAFT_449035 [Xylaria cubensis]